jgi:hypothetical protein
MPGRRPTYSINVSGVRGPNDMPSAIIAKLNDLPNLATSPIAFSAMASDLRRASRAWFRAAASCPGMNELAPARSGLSEAAPTSA